MNKNGPIVVIEDDVDDQEMLSEIFVALNYPNKILFFENGQMALEYLSASHEKPFLILSDINLPKLTGLELRDKLHNNEALRLKCIPYLFLTTAASQQAVIKAYSSSIQGFFVKPLSYGELERMIKRILEYWQDCVAPNYVA